MADDVRTLLSSVSFTRDLQQVDLDRLADMAAPVTWRAGQTIFREGQSDESFYLIVEGRVAIDIAVPRRGPVRILTLSAGEVFGWSSIFHRKPKTAGATAVEATRALALKADRLRDLSEADPRFGYWLARRLLEVLAERLKATRLQMLDVFGG